MIRALISLVFLLIAPLASSEYGLIESVPVTRTLSTSSDICYEESFDDTINSDRGYYHSELIRFLPEGNAPRHYEWNLTQLRVDLSLFTAPLAGGEDIPLTKDMLDALEETIAYVESKEHCMIIRFAYDPWFDGVNPHEPSLDMILYHQEQLGEVLSRHKNAIACVETGLLGAWGELHSTDMCTTAVFSATLNQWLTVLPESVCVTARTPWHYCAWKNIDLDTISSDITYPGEKAYRVGIYNDGYLGTWSDWGTFHNREEEIKWLFNQARHTLYGGEMAVISDIKEGQTYSSFVENEAFRTHTSYVNYDFHPVAVNTLLNEIYSSKDEYYHGQSGYTFVRNHLGYRLILRKADITTEVTKEDTLLIKTYIDNVGFGNIVKPKKLFLIFEGAGGRQRILLTGYDVVDDEYVINCDPVEWNSDTRICTRINIHVPKEISSGNYKLYFKIAYDTADVDEGFGDYPVQLANNDENMWNPELGANYIGQIRIIDKR